jgi:acetyl esterase/lipase
MSISINMLKTFAAAYYVIGLGLTTPQLARILFTSTPAGLAGTSLFVWAMIFYTLTGTLDSMINANYAALFPELFRTTESRAAANAMRQDDLYPLSRAFPEACRALGIPVEYHEEDGKHDWFFWDAEIKRFLEVVLGPVPSR